MLSKYDFEYLSCEDFDYNSTNLKFIIILS